ncbi:MAG TPA: hypothetical protein IAB00_03880 [Candidatus Avidehalobacter gallistercoris]|uniref:Uncharacterized protein n=1 Tax=Candidatus Avidehalobacter gallistercoris TaxID=2840694 RepID=A0A9D1HJE7_9FIRM|nr:hypothetical protein [Candidatus Avidehalobacter gallistercoris]
MFEINVTVNAPEIAEALNNLAAALKGAKPEPAASKTGKADKPAPVPPADYMPPADTAPAPAAPAPAVTPAPAPAPAPVQAPVTPAPAPAPVPVAPAPTYSRDQIMTAGAALIDAGKINELMGLLNSFGVQAVTQLKQDQLGAFATELRKLGAQI